MSADTLYIGTHGHVAAIRLEDGQELWRTKLGGGFLAHPAYENVCVLEHEGKILAGCQGHLFCLDGSTGHILWHNPLKGMRHNVVTLTIAGKSIQFAATHTRTPS